MDMPIKAIKSLMSKEIHSHYSAACQNCHHEVQRGFIHRGYHDVIIPKLQAAETEEDLQEVLNLLDYRMTIQEWINSL